jgi:hypothetical protein
LVEDIAPVANDNYNSDDDLVEDVTLVSYLLGLNQGRAAPSHDPIVVETVSEADDASVDHATPDTADDTFDDDAPPPPCQCCQFPLPDDLPPSSNLAEKLLYFQ